MDLIHYDRCPYEKGQFEHSTHAGRIPCEEPQGEDSQGERAGTDSSAHPSEGTSPAVTLISHFQATKTMSQKFSAV